MAALYIHIPFCKSRCAYCNFFSTMRLDLREKLTMAITKEMQLRSDYLMGQNVSTIYWGGGTPSVLRSEEVEQIMCKIQEIFQIDKWAEVTIEANPDDVTVEKAHFWKEIGFNRVSMGVQSFDDTILKVINRRHTSQQAKYAIENLKKVGFDNISIDLIYGLPTQNIEGWKNDVRTATQLGIQHISSYGLTIEPDTLLYKMREDGALRELDDDTYNAMYDFLCEYLEEKGFEHYEVSNFALSGYRSRHNCSYWNNTPYLGIGPGAHSYNGNSRQWNVENLEEYIEVINQGSIPSESEELTPLQKWEEYVMLRMRTMEGMNLQEVNTLFGLEATENCLTLAYPYIQQGYLQHTDNSLLATKKGIKILNRIITDLID